MRSRLKRIIRKLLTPKGDKTFHVGDLKLTIDQRDQGGLQYEGRQSVEEHRSQFYDQLRSTLNPNVIVDVGANYGFTGALLGTRFPRAKLILVEPDPKLGRYIRMNMAQNNIAEYLLYESMCSETAGQGAEFGINPVSSQDNRVTGLRGWKSITVQTVSISNILVDHSDKRVFIKLDTQGHETQVIKGAEDFLANSENWLIKSEFAPHWLHSQGNSPENFMKYLLERYRVTEAPSRTRFERDTLPNLFQNPIKEYEIEKFIDHVKSLNHGGRGWVDIYIAPQKATWLE